MRHLRKPMTLRYVLLLLTALALCVWGAAVELPHRFRSGDVISAGQMNETMDALNTGKQDRVASTCAAGSSIRSIAEDGSVTCEVDDIGPGSSTSGVDAVNGMTGAVTLQAGSNITIDDSAPGQIVISAAGGTGGGADTFGETLTGTSASSPGLSVINLASDQGGTTAIRGRVGANSASLGLNAIGVWGEVPSGAGVAGSTPQGFGVYGQSGSNAGVFGQSDSGNGVRAQSSGSDAAAYALSSGSGPGVEGAADSGAGVFGHSSGIGVWGRSATRGVVGTIDLVSCPGSYGVGGCADSAIGVLGSSHGSDGVYGATSAAGQSGVRGVASGTTVAYGVIGSSTSGIGVYGESTNNAGVFGRSTNNNAAYFTGGSGGSGACYFNGGAGWSCTSDRNAKEDFHNVDPEQLLSDLSSIPVQSWVMKGDTTGARHLGPTAQDFRQAFGLGDSDTTINTVDAQGVALAAAQGLYRLVEAQQAQISELEARLDALESPAESH